MFTLDYHRKYAWDWLAILLLMVVLVITEELKPFEKSIYNETDQVSCKCSCSANSRVSGALLCMGPSLHRESNSVVLQHLPWCMTDSITFNMQFIVMQDIPDEHMPTAGLTFSQCKASRFCKSSHSCSGDIGNVEV